jgi:hypothetical protein
MNSTFYLPILKSKEGEFNALSKLNSFTKKHICPLFDIPALEFDNATKKKPKTLEEHLFNFCNKKFLKKWGTSQCFMDPHLVKNEIINNCSALEYVYSQIGDCLLLPITPTPVVRINNSESEQIIFSNIIAKYNIEELAIRLTLDEISTELKNKIDTILSTYSVNVSNMHLIFDLSDSNFTYFNDFSDAIVAVLEDFPYLKEWKSFTICGGAFPPTNILMKGENYVPRDDWNLYNDVIKKMLKSNFNRPINFGDYGIVSPGHFNFDPKIMKRSANIRYTFNDSWFVLKGSALQNSDDYLQYVDQAKIILQQPFFYGEEFSAGDKQLKNCCIGTVSPGNPTVWNWVGNNHHFTKVVSDLFSNLVVV